MADDLTTTIVEEAGKAQSVSVDGTSVARKDLSKIIEADKYLKQNAAIKKRGGILFQRIVPPGAT